MTREEAINEIKSWDFLEGKEIEAIHTLIPELRESEDERIRKELIEFIKWSVDRHFMKEDFHQAKRPLEWIAYLEKQKENIEKEYVFRPLAGTDITIAAEQAIRRVMEGDHLVLAFNGWYVPVDKHATIKGLVDGYYTFIEKQKEEEGYEAIPIENTLEYKAGFHVGKEFEKQQEQTSSIPWVKSDNVTNPDKPYIDKAGWFYTTDGRMCPALEIEKQKERKEIPLMNGDADLYFDDWKQERQGSPTKRECFNEGIKYAQMLQKEQKPNYCHYGGDPNIERCKYCSAACSARLTEEQKPAEWNPTKEQMVALSWVANGMLDNDSPSAGDIKASLLSLYNCLQSKSIKPAEWSDEDEKMLNLAIEWAETMSSQFSFVGMEPTDFRKIASWLKSLRPSWKPSEEQIHAIIEALKYLPNNKDEWRVLNTLVDVFRKLM